MRETDIKIGDCVEFKFKNGTCIALKTDDATYDDIAVCRSDGRPCIYVYQYNPFDYYTYVRHLGTLGDVKQKYPEYFV